MEIPQKIKIGGHTYTIIVTDDKNIVDEDSYGNRDDSKMEIALSKKVFHSQQEETLLHEILHCINNELSEVTIQNIAQGLYQVLKDNKLQF